MHDKKGDFQNMERLEKYCEITCIIFIWGTMELKYTYKHYTRSKYIIINAVRFLYMMKYSSTLLSSNNPKSITLLLCLTDTWCLLIILYFFIQFIFISKGNNYIVGWSALIILRERL